MQLEIMHIKKQDCYMVSLYDKGRVVSFMAEPVVFRQPNVLATVMNQLFKNLEQDQKNKWWKFWNWGT